MEEPQEVHFDENRAHPEKKQKRIVKTREQVAALESFYNEHKYPTEAMKMELAQSIGLTDKQVSGWFCHRRLKDKKSPNDEVQALGKQDRSSGVIQDRGSGLRQDSCGSTKQADNKHPDPKEVESRRYTAEGLLPTELRYDHRSQHNNIMEDDTSSGSSSPLKDNFHPQNMDHLGMVTLKYPSHNDLRSVKGRTGPSGYLKVKVHAENAAITAVKRQLGRNYREDGPPLGIEFEPLPPGAFENPVKIPVNQSYYVGDHNAIQSPDGSKAFQPSNASKMYERYNPKSYHAVDFDESGLEMSYASKHPKIYHGDNQYKQAPHLSKHRHSLSGRSLQADIDDSFGETSVHDIREHFETRKKYGPGVRIPDSLVNSHSTAYGKSVDVKQIENNPRNYTPKVIYREHMEPMTSVSSAVKRGEFLELQDQGMSKKTFKDDKFVRERRGVDEYSKLVSAKTHPGNVMPVTKRSRDEFTHQGYSRNEALIDVPPRTTMTNRSSVQMTASFSDDETPETTSSGD